MGTRPLGVVLLAAFDTGETEAAAAQAAAPAVKRLLLAGLASLGLGLLGATWVSASFTRTIKKLMQGAHEVGAGHFSVRVMTRRGDELGELSDQFNEMGVKLAELERLKDSFLAKITHDLRSPLGAIVCYADVILMGLQGPLTDKQKNSLKLIVASGNDLAELVNNILDLTKLEAGKMNFAPAEVPLRPLAQAVVDLLQVKANEFAVQFDASGIPEGITLWADEQALKRLLSNLLSNSLKFTPEGGRVSLQWQRSDSGDDVIAVKDTGIGIPADKIPTLFQKFSQVEETMHKVRFARGTGLGLAICREIAEGHGGRIWVESEYQKGSTFYVSLPKKKEAAKAAA
jgi:signal transduction histidine kinase